MDCNIDLYSGSQKESVHAASETLRDSTDSTSRSHATVLHELSPLELLEGMNERVGESPPVCSTKALSDTWTSVEEVGANSKDDGEAFAFVTENTLKQKCLQASSNSLYTCHFCLFSLCTNSRTYYTGSVLISFSLLHMKIFFICYAFEGDMTACLIFFPL